MSDLFDIKGRIINLLVSTISGSGSIFLKSLTQIQNKEFRIHITANAGLSAGKTAKEKQVVSCCFVSHVLIKKFFVSSDKKCHNDAKSNSSLHKKGKLKIVFR
jgi:hypothetical protein